MHSVISALDEIRGIGRWTAEMFLIFSLHRCDVFAMDDLGLRKAVARAYKLEKPPDKKMLARISARWSSYRSIASLYLWRSGDTKIMADLESEA